LVVAQQTLPSTFDPHLANETVVWSTLSNVLEGLVRFSPQLQVEPALASHWEQLSPTLWRFTLRRGVVFHNGKPLSARDVVASLHRAQTHPRSQVKHFLAGVLKVQAQGDEALLLETSTPAPTLLRRLIFLLVVPEEQCPEAEIRVPVGTGPYRITRRQDSSLELEAVAWWGGTPTVAKAKFLFMEDEAARTQAFLRGEVDVCAWLREEDLSELRHRRKLVAVQQPRLAVQLLAIIPQAAQGPAAAALADKRVRKALALAVDRQRLISQVAWGNATVASQFVHPLVFGYDPALTPLPYDPQKARQLLAEAGFPGGFEVELGLGSGAQATGQRLAEDWAQIGVRTTLRALPFPELMAAARAGQIPLVFFARTCTTSDASEFLDPQVHCPDPQRGLGLENYPRFCHPEVDRLLEAAAGELDEEKRRALLQKAQRLVLEEAPYVPLLIRWSHLGLRRPWSFQPRYDQYLFLPAFSLAPQD
jgi:peptide/nickel transport system substrate-binding protein